jgi:hypothetical protein
MKISGKIIVVFFVISSWLGVSAQKIDSALNMLATQDPREKIYIQYDKEYYVAGETIWFKVYLYSDGKPGGMSSNLYIKFTDSKGQVILNKQYPVLGAVARGNIDIPDSLSQGNYYIRAFTTGMLNYDEAFIYTKNIFVLNPSVMKIARVPEESKQVSLQFFPESGNLVAGILTVVGFKATDQWGTPVDVNGVIRSEDGITIASFKSYHDGIGNVQFKPQAGKRYIAEMETVTGTRSFPLPAVQPSGINLKIRDEKGSKKFQLSRSEKDQAQFDNLLLVAEINNHIVFENEIVFEDYSSVIGHLVTDSLPSGILHFTVFNKDGIPLAGRLSFVDNGEYRGSGAVTIIKTGTEKRAENIVELNFPDSIQRSCSVAVIDIPMAGLNDNDNIWSRFLLTSDLKGYIHNPSWYFVRHPADSFGENKNDTVKQSLDNLMLTQGWSRFNWSKILANEFPRKKNTDTYLINISGIVYTETDTRPVQGGKLNVVISDQDSSLFTYNIPVNENGQFLIDSLNIVGKTKLFYTYTDKRGAKKSVFIKTNENILPDSATKPFYGALEKYPVARPIDSKTQDIVSRYKFAGNGNQDAKLLENVVVTTKQKRPVDIMNEKYTSDLFSTGGKIKIDNINFPPVDKAMNGLDFVLNRISTVAIQNGTFVNKKNFSIQDHKGDELGRRFKPLYKPGGPMRFWEVGLFINEIPSEIIQLQVLRADQIAMVKFFEAGSLVSGSAYPGGAIVVYLNYETSSAREEEKSKYIEYNGYSISKEFYNPDYSVPGTNNNRVDNRSTLYWNPEIVKENQSRTVQFKFFNNDYSKQFKIVVEGFDVNGRLIHIEKITGN